MERLVAYHWPGNVRELENVVERSILLAKGPRVAADEVRIDMSIGRARPAATSADGFLPEGMTLDQYEQSLIKEALKRANGNKSHAARLLGLTRNALRYRLTQMGIE
jgi:DNA-binding NtrC family response regulator